MILEFLINIVVTLLSGFISGVSLASIPVDMIKALQTVCAYGSWIVGADLLLVFASCVFVWTGVRIASGIVVFIWKMLPLT